MTTCVGVVCDEGKTIILAADKMIGFGYIESEPDISKIRYLHKNWRVLIAGNGLEPAFTIIDIARSTLAPIPAPTLDVAMDALETAYQDKRTHDAEATFLKPIGWDQEQFRTRGVELLGDVAATQIRDSLDRFEYELDFLVAGFDDQNIGCLFSVRSHNRGIATRHDLGFYAIGCGEINARFIMAHRKVAPKMILREALFYALEGKYYGELASGVGVRTDMVIMRAGKDDLPIHEDNLEILFDKICGQVDPRELTDRHVRLLNTIPELGDIATMPLPSARKKKQRVEQKEREKWSKGASESP